MRAWSAFIPSVGIGFFRSAWVLSCLTGIVGARGIERVLSFTYRFAVETYYVQRYVNDYDRAEIIWPKAQQLFTVNYNVRSAPECRIC